MSTAPETKTVEQIEATQAAMNDAGLGHWKVVSADGASSDPFAYFRAERVGPLQTVIHREAKVLVELAKAADERMGLAKPVQVSSGLQAAINP